MSLKNKFKLTSVALASAVAMGAMAMPTVASAEVSSSAAISSMYLWRGQNVSGQPILSGDIAYSHESGAYASVWMASESQYDTEVDVTVGFAGTAGPVGYDLKYYKFWYPEGGSATAEGEKFADAGAEFVVGLTFDPVTFTAYLDAKDKDDGSYYTLSAGFGKFGLLYGLSDSKTAGADYSHVDISYAASDKVSFTVSNASGDGLAKGKKDPLFMMSYSLPI